MKNNIKTNNLKAWESLYGNNYLSGGTNLPAWGIYSSGTELSNKLLRIKGHQLLELACGLGDSLKYILTKDPKSYVGIDISSTALKCANKNYQKDNISFIQTDISNALPFPNESFDEVFSVYGLGWSKNIKYTLSEIYRILKPGGTLTFSWDHYLARIVEEHNGKLVINNSYNEEQPTIRFNWNQTGYNIQTFQATPSKWFQLLQSAGFTVTAFYELSASKNKSQEHVFSKTYSASRANKIPFTIVLQAKK